MPTPIKQLKRRTPLESLGLSPYHQDLIHAVVVVSILVNCTSVKSGFNANQLDNKFPFREYSSSWR